MSELDHGRGGDDALAVPKQSQTKELDDMHCIRRKSYDENRAAVTLSITSMVGWLGQLLITNITSFSSICLSLRTSATRGRNTYLTYLAEPPEEVWNCET
jgi:hypothetical protein